MSRRQRHLASVMRKMLVQRENWDGCYINICDDSVCIDGWVNDLTPEEVKALRDLWKETQA